MFLNLHSLQISGLEREGSSRGSPEEGPPTAGNPAIKGRDESPLVRSRNDTVRDRKGMILMVTDPWQVKRSHHGVCKPMANDQPAEVMRRLAECCLKQKEAYYPHQPTNSYRRYRMHSYRIETVILML